MAKQTIDILLALRNTAERLQSTVDYQWGHMGSCNCGFLAQEVTRLSKDQIHNGAMEKHGDWQEQIRDYCPDSGLLMDDIITQMIAFGFDGDELKHLEMLSDPKILDRFPVADRNLQRNQKSDVIRYLTKWAEMIEDEIIQRERVRKRDFEFI
ncbi:MAG TPA: hypothetical protein VD927_04840 [Chryseosolibacter sp.]|nr:hypothetical protein [Chryseosolibacter sp.]